MGFTAQELAEVFPDLVQENVPPPAAGTDDSQSQKFLSVNYIGLVPVLVKAIQEQQRTIEKLEKDMRALRGAE